MEGHGRNLRCCLHACVFVRVYLFNHIQHYGVHTPTQMLIPDPGHPKGEKITAGCSHRGLGVLGFSGITSKYLFLSACMDRTGLIWQLQCRDAWERRVVVVGHQMLRFDKNTVNECQDATDAKIWSMENINLPTGGFMFTVAFCELSLSVHI